MATALKLREEWGSGRSNVWGGKNVGNLLGSSGKEGLEEVADLQKLTDKGVEAVPKFCTFACLG